MRTVLLSYILFILMIINTFKSIGVFADEINFYTNYVSMELFGEISSLIVDNEIKGEPNE